MAEHVTEAVVVHCIDFRFQKFIDAWLQENLGMAIMIAFHWQGGCLTLNL